MPAPQDAVNEASIESAQLLAHIRQMNADTEKLIAEARQFRMSTFLAPFIAGAGVVGATAALVRIFFSG